MAARNRGPSFTEEEDITLCGSYIRRNRAQITGRDLSGMHFWVSVFNLFDSETENPHLRDSVSLQSRFATITGSVLRFVARVMAIHRVRFAGLRDTEIIETAMYDWKEDEGRPFRFGACFDMLRTHLERFEPFM